MIKEHQDIINIPSLQKRMLDTLEEMRTTFNHNKEGLLIDKLEETYGFIAGSMDRCIDIISDIDISKIDQNTYRGIVKAIHEETDKVVNEEVYDQ